MTLDAERGEVLEVGLAAERERHDVVHCPVRPEPRPARLASSFGTGEHDATQTLTRRAGRRAGRAAAVCLTSPRLGRVELAATPAGREARASRLGTHPSRSHHRTPSSSREQGRG
jgi:hypothetical protein